MSHLALSLLGPFQARLDDDPIRSFQTSKVQALLIFLAVESQQVHRREDLMLLLWPDLPLKSAQLNLRQTLHRLRQTIPEVTSKTGDAVVPILVVDRQTAQLNPEAGVEIDVARFTELVADTATPDQLAQAVALYQGDFLADFYLPDSEEFEDWASSRRAAWRRQVLEALDRLTGHHLSQGALDRAETYARRQLDLDDLRESAYQQLMMILAQKGQRSDALEQYRQCRQRLLDELAAEPSAETTALYERIRAGEIDQRNREVSQKPSADRSSPLQPRPSALPQPLVAAQSTVVAYPKVSTNLPPQPTPFIGREEELTDLDHLLGDLDLRLVTIVGPGGIGKTRLALAAAERQLERAIVSQAGPTDESRPLFNNGVHFVELTALREPDRIVSAIANALNFSVRTDTDEMQQVETPVNTPKHELLDYLRQKCMLLVIDNFEHLLEGATLLSDILRAAPNVQILVTSRERLHLQEEQVYPIQGLEFPDWETPQDAARYTAVRLFMQSAHRIQPDFELQAGDLTYLTRICRLVAGMPLGIELAASWVDMLPLADIAAEIQKSLDILETDILNIPARHRSIRAVFDYSWQQLSQAERDIFQQLSVFRGGFTRAAAQAVTGASLRLLARLVGKSLLQFNQTRERYEIHELLRQYGAEKLAQMPDQEAAIRDQHCAYFCAWLAERFAVIKVALPLAVLSVIEADIENAQSAWNWAGRRQQMDRISEAVDGLANFYLSNYRLQDGLTALQKVLEPFTAELEHPEELELPPASPLHPVLAKLLAWQGRFYLTAGQIELAAKSLGAGQALLDSPALAGHDTRAIEAYLLKLQGYLASFRSDYENVLSHLEQSLALFRELEDSWEVADTLAMMGWADRRRTNYARAKARYEESLALIKQLGCTWCVVDVLTSLGWVARETKQYQRAKELYTEALELAETIDGLWDAQYTLMSLAFLSLFQGEFEAAKGHLQRILSLVKDVGRPVYIAAAIIQLGSAYWFCGDFERGYELVSEGVEMFKDLEAPYDLVIALGFQAAISVHRGHYDLARSQAQSALREGDSIGETYITVRANRILGWVALAENDYSEAYRYLQESIRIHRQTSKDREIVAWTLAPLGRAALGLGYRSQAHEYLYEALEIAADMEAFIPTLFILPMVALALAEAGELERAADLWAVSSRHPFVGRSPLLEAVAGQPIARLTTSLPADVVEASRRRADTADWWQTVEALLPTLRDLGWVEVKQAQT